MRSITQFLKVSIYKQLSWVALGLSRSWGCRHLKTQLGMGYPLLDSLTWLLAGLSFLLAVDWRLPFFAGWVSPEGFWQHSSLLSPEPKIQAREAGKEERERGPNMEVNLL